jgi:hypothetical protein
VVSFGQKQLPWIVEYIDHQREHHSSGRVFGRLEAYEADEDGDSANGSEDGESG